MTNCTEFTFDSSPDTVIWPLAAVAANVAMDMHTYKDYIMSCAGVLGGEGKRKHDSEGSNILQYFCYLGQGQQLALEMVTCCYLIQLFHTVCHHAAHSPRMSFALLSTSKQP